MELPRVILADTDLSYLLPLVQRFAEKFGDSISLEVIDNQEYLRSLFSSPQKLLALIIDENLYDPSLRIHNIDNMFLLCESEEGEKKDKNVQRVLKYASVVEVFNRVSAIALPSVKHEKTQIVAVCSAAGGVGKTTIALGIAGFLSRCSKKVLYINTSNLQYFQSCFDDQSVIHTQEFYNKILSPGKNLFRDIRQAVRTEHFSYLPPFKMALLSVGLSNTVFEKIVASAKSAAEYDYIVVDTDSGFDETSAYLMGIAEKVVLVTGQGKTSALATERLAENISGVSGEKYCFLCCNFREDEDNALSAMKDSLCFSISGYIEHFNNYDCMNCEDFSRKESIQRAALLVM